ncbi:hypothetical protein OGH69_12950 [Flavobacterium sp. MFBS3-15]|uniref:hypothetical protein n=1 Tax=Flavobacterium sp. MFBS3-15 TaxID=2989816 RepID=UPI002235DC53|nr:hypothetical protein [Flavobacterium sp. MFBS3-15]MCW4469881.1 hypothetical protein [Flavobacterium sp. MFBS3-15]
MALSPLLARKSSEYKNHLLVALNFYFKKQYEHCCGDLRKAGEALMKCIIIKHFGDNEGEEIILGNWDHKNQISIIPAKNIEYQDLLDVVKDSKITNASNFSRLIDIQKKCNPSAHNPNKPIDFKQSADLCKQQLFELTKFLYDYISETVPNDLQQAFNGEINEAQIQTITSNDWDQLLLHVDNFSHHSKYILVAPPKFSVKSNHIELLSRINWSFIIDFDSNTKKEGLYQAFEVIYKDRILPLTIKQKGLKNIVGSGTHGNVNWLFANGLQSISDSVTKDIKSWRSAKYHIFLKDLFTEYFSKSLSRYIIIYLWDDLNYLEEIVRAISEIENVSKDLVQHIFLSIDQDIISKIHEFDKFDIKYNVFNLSHQNFISELSNVIEKNNSENEKILVPARTRLEEQTFIDISNIYSKLLDNDLQVVYQNIELNNIKDFSDLVPPFFEGEKVTWYELSIDIEARRSKYDELLAKIQSQLSSLKRSVKFDLLHKPGAGGTTLGNRLAFDCRSQFPVVIIGKYDKVNTFRSLSLFIDKVNRPILAIVEASDIGLNDLEDLQRICNANKLNVLFVYVRRILKIDRATDLSFYLNDYMSDINERNRFLSKVGQYAKHKTTLEILSKQAPLSSEVIDFALAVNEEEYNSERLINYLQSYIQKMKEHQVRFTAYVSLVYYYSQKNVSELIFRSLFNKSLTEELRQTSVAEQYIRKILIQEYDQDNLVYTEYWRPRFSKFATVVLEIVLGADNSENWKDNLCLYCLDFIKSIKENNEYLVEETRDILKSIFLERNNEDLLGVEEQWNTNVSTEQFSYLLRDIANKKQMKSVLLALVDAYPTESHFLGHLGRFIYETAEEEEEFAEAEKYIVSSLDYAKSDYNLQHIGGMCKRRHIELLRRNYSKDGSSEIVDEKKIKDLTEEANVYFNKSRSINPYNIHAYIAQIQTIILTIDFGRELSGIDKKDSFITNSKYIWYLEQYERLVELIDEAQIVIEQQETLGKTNKILKSKNYLESSEGRSFELLGDYRTSIQMYKTLIEKADRSFRPRLRLMYINSILMGKVKGDRSKINTAWSLLTIDEIKDFQKNLDDNILQEPGNLYTLRLWLKLVRYSNISISIEEIISRLKIWYDHSEDAKILHLESAYYLYVLNACMAIKAGDTFSSEHQKEAVKYIAKCRELSKYDKFSFEFYGRQDGIDCLINHKLRASNDGDLERVKGTISLINSRQQGKIILQSGLEAFFVPHVGNFIQGKEETSEVNFFIGFRHDGLFAIDVRRDAEENQILESSNHKIDNNVIDNEETQQVLPVEEIREELSEKRDRIIIKAPKIVGTIDLSQIKNSRKRKN